MRIVLVPPMALASAVLLSALSACGDEEQGAGPGGLVDARVVVTTNILGDVVRELVGDDAQVEVIMPPNSDPHDFAASAKQAASMREADVLVINGLGFEEGLIDDIEAAKADGTVVVTASDAIETIELAGEQGTDDPHLFTDPVRMGQAAERIGDELAEQIPELDTPAFQARVDGYVAELGALDLEVRALLAGIAPEQRVLLTNHEVFGYFAERYGFEVLGAIFPGGSTLAEPSAADLADLAGAIDQRDLPAIFADTTSPSRLADALAAEGTDVEVVQLFSESLGEPGREGDTYIGMVRANAERMAAALG